MISKKLPSWPERLSIFTLERKDQPYQWGLNDCVTFAADAIWAMTGQDPIADIRGSWTDEVSAMNALTALGGLVKAVDRKFTHRVEPKFAQRGDLCGIKVDGRLSLAICVGASAAAPGADEMLMTPMNFVRIAWTV